jgi:hypothetical protein
MCKQTLHNTGEIMEELKAGYEATMDLLVATGDAYPETLAPIKAYVAALETPPKKAKKVKKTKKATK